MSDSLTPKNRKEQFLQDISDGKTDFAPKNREECFLKNIADAVNNSGDMVIPFTINSDDEPATSNAASFEEVDAALRAGRRVVAVLERHQEGTTQEDIWFNHILILESHRVIPPDDPNTEVTPIWQCFGNMHMGGLNVGVRLTFPDATTREITMEMD